MRNIYLALSALFLLVVFLLNVFVYPSHTSPVESLQFDINPAKGINNPIKYLASFAAMLMIVLLYLSIITAGIVNLIIAINRKNNKQPVIHMHDEPEKTFPISLDDATRLFFHIISLLLLVYLGEIFIFRVVLRDKTFSDLTMLNFSLFSNVIIEATTILLTLRLFSESFLGLRVKKSFFVTLLKIYTATVPLLLITALINNFLAKLINVPTAINPAVEILLKISDKPTIFALFLQAAILAPLSEELFFRGFLYKMFRTKHTFFISASVTSLFFAVIHGTPQDILPLAILGAALCYVYEKTQDITVPVIMHALHNSLSLTYLLVMKSLSS